MSERLIINSKGQERIIHQVEQSAFPDKKPSIVDEQSILLHLDSARKLYRDMEVGQRTASAELKPLYPDIPVFIWLNCDDHIGSVLTDYRAFLADYNVVKDTPNFYCLSNGDEVDNFMVTLGNAATGVYEQSITPNQQALLIQSLFKKLDDQDKMLALSFGNHNQWLRGAGYKFENTWLREFRCPVLNCGGLLTIKYGEQEYKVAMTHSYWGKSKLNPTNTAKRYMDYEYPSADVIFLGHTHQSEALCFKRDKETEYKWAIIGGTYKTEDEWSAEMGIGNGGKIGGMVLMLSPNKRDIGVMKSVEEARQYFELLREIKRHIT